MTAPHPTAPPCSRDAPCHPHVLARLGARDPARRALAVRPPEESDHGELSHWWREVVDDARPGGLAAWERPFHHASRHYAHGHCDAFAVGLSLASGLPVRAWWWRARLGADLAPRDLAIGTWARACRAEESGVTRMRFLRHAAVLLPDGRLRDADGRWEGMPRQVCRAMGDPAAGHLIREVDYSAAWVRRVPLGWRGIGPAHGLAAGPREPAVVREVARCLSRGLLPGTGPRLGLAEAALRLRFIDPRRLHLRALDAASVAEFTMMEGAGHPGAARAWERLTTAVGNGAWDLGAAWGFLPRRLRPRFLADAAGRLGADPADMARQLALAAAADRVQDAFLTSGFDLRVLAGALGTADGRLARLLDPWIDEVWLPLLGPLTAGRA